MFAKELILFPVLFKDLRNNKLKKSQGPIGLFKMNIGTSLNSRITIVINARHTEEHPNNIIITNNIQLI